MTLSATNPQSTSEVARVGIRVQLAGGSFADLKSSNLAFGPGETKSVNLAAPGTIVTIEDSPETFSPA